MKKNDLLIILIPTLLCVLAWIVFNIYHSAVTPTISEEQTSQVSPISPDFDTNTILKLKNRNFIEINLQNNGTTTITIKPTTTLKIQANSKNTIASMGGKLK
jgi:hypothetical protein